MKVLDCMDQYDRSEFLDIGEETLALLTGDEVNVRDKDELLSRLDKIQSPHERLKEFALSLLPIHKSPTHEAQTIKYMAVTGVLCGWIFGGIIRSGDHHEAFIRQYNASVFDGSHRARRGYLDTYVYTVLRRGAKFGVGTGLLSMSAGLIGFGSISYRNQLYLPDWLAGFAVVGAATRCWLGLRGVIAGAGFGMAAGAFGYGFAKSMEAFSGESVTRLRYLNHLEHLKREEARLSHQQRMRQDADREFMSPWA